MNQEVKGKVLLSFARKSALQFVYFTGGIALEFPVSSPVNLEGFVEREESTSPGQRLCSRAGADGLDGQALKHSHLLARQGPIAPFPRSPCWPQLC